jgi:hypothetical protein
MYNFTYIVLLGECTPVFTFAFGEPLSERLGSPAVFSVA